MLTRLLVFISLCAVVARVLAPSVLGVLAGIVSLGKAAAETTEDDEEGDKDDSEDNQLPESGMSDTVIGPCAASSREVILELVGSKLVVDQASESDGITEELEGRNRISEDDH